MQDPAAEGDESAGRDEGGDREQDGQDGGDQRAEGDQQDAEGERDGRPLGAGEVVGELLVHPLAGAGVAEFHHGEVGVLLLDGGDGVDHGADVRGGLLVVAPHGELDERGAAVGGDGLGVVGGADVGGPAGGVDPGDHLVDGGAEGGGVGGPVGALDQDGLGGGGLESGPVEDLGGPGDLAGHRLGLVDLGAAVQAAEEGGEDDEQQPAEDGGLSVPGAPCAHGGGHAGLGLHASPWKSGRRRWRARAGCTAAVGRRSGAPGCGPAP